MLMLTPGINTTWASYVPAATRYTPRFKKIRKPIRKSLESRCLCCILCASEGALTDRLRRLRKRTKTNFPARRTSSETIGCRGQHIRHGASADHRTAARRLVTSTT